MSLSSQTREVTDLDNTVTNALNTVTNYQLEVEEVQNFISKAVVTSQDPDNYGINVACIGAHGGAGPTIAVQVLTDGPRDAVTGDFPELPTPGTHGLVVFPSGDGRNGMWLGAYSSNLLDVSPHGPGKGNVSHTAHYGGGYSDRAMDGSYTEAFPDGSVLRVGPTTAAPTRHTLAGQSKARTAWPVSQRVTTTPTPFTAVLTQPTGATATLSPQGGWTFHAAAGQALTLSGNGATVTLDATGQITATAAGGGMLVLDATGNVTITASIVNVTNGVGLLQPVKLANNANSIVLKAV